MLKLPIAIVLACSLTTALLNPTPSYSQTAPIAVTPTANPAQGALNSALTKYEAGDFKGAIQELNSAIALDNKYIDAYLYRGALLGLGEPDLSQPNFRSSKTNPQAAIADFDRIIALDAKHVRAHAYRGYAKLAMGDRSGRKDLAKAIALAPNSPIPYFIKSLAYVGKKDAPEYLSSPEIKKLVATSRQQEGLFCLIFIQIGMSQINDIPRDKEEDNSQLTTAKAYFDRAIDKFDSLNFKGAILDLDRTIAIDAKYPKAHFYRGLIAYIGAENLSQALVDLDRAIELDPNNSNLLMVRVYTSIALESSGRPAASQKNRASFDRAIAANPKIGDIYLLRSLFNRMGNLDSKNAVKDVLTASKIYRDLGDLEMYFIAHLSFMHMAKSPVTSADYLGLAGELALTDEAGFFATIDKAISLDPKNSTSYSLSAKFKSYKKDYAGALADLDRSIAIQPEAFSYIARANIKSEKLKDYLAALLDYDRAIALQPKDSYLYSQRAEFKADKLKDNNSALGDFDRAVSLDLKSTRYYFKRATFKAEQLKDNRGALVDYNLAIAINPTNAFPYINRGKFNAKYAKDLKAALADYNRAIEIDPENGSLYILRAQFKAEFLQDLKDAAIDYDLAIASRKNSADFYAERAAFKAEKLNDNRGALADFDRAVELSSIFSEFYSQRGKFKATRLQDKTGAIADYRAALKFYRKERDLAGFDRTLAELKALGVTVKLAGI
jgi:tetratricopeptide (TPR) repeat protein